MQNVTTPEARYCFIDFGYLTMAYNKFCHDWCNSDGELDIRLMLEWLPAEKYFFYHAVEDSPKSGELEPDFKKRTAVIDSVISEIRSLPACHFQLGKVVGSGKRRRQKGVDVWLAVDALGHAHAKNCKTVMLVAGDADFVPLAEALVRHGAYVHAIGARGSNSEDLGNACDVSNELTFFDFVVLTKGTKRLEMNMPSVMSDSYVHMPNQAVQRVAQYDTEVGRLAIYKLNDGRFGFSVDDKNFGRYAIYQSDLSMLEKAMKMAFPKGDRVNE